MKLCHTIRSATFFETRCTCIVHAVFSGCENLHINSEGCTVVLEESGAEIDGDETLRELDGSALMILKPDDEWSSTPSQNKRTATGKTLDYSRHAVRQSGAYGTNPFARSLHQRTHDDESFAHQLRKYTF